jgi:Dynamin family
VLRERTADAFGRASRRLDELNREGADVAAGRIALARYTVRLAAPMRVAVVGRVSSGKSTLTNALLGCRLVATGIEELTYNVNWLRYADDQSLVVHFKDGSSTQRFSLGELERLTSRREAHQDLLASIDFIEVFFANDQLRIYDLIDTPGLDSHFGADSQNTLRFLRRTGQEVRDTTLAHTRGADALLLVFGRSISETDIAALSDVQGPEFASLTPITAIGVLAKIEHYWPGEPAPMESARRVAERLMTHATVRRLLYDVIPVCSLVGAAADTFTESDLETLSELAKLAPDRLATLARRAEHFCTRDYADVTVPPDLRKSLFGLFGGWGIVLATRLIREGASDHGELRAQLLEYSGMTRLRTLISAHFGNRAQLIKLQQTVAELRRQNGTADRSVAAITAEIENLALNEHGFAELALLRDHYRGVLALSEAEATELLQVTGEHGVWITDRLGLGRQATLDEMYLRASQRAEYWGDRSDDPELTGYTRLAAKQLRRSYELLAYHVREARRHLELVQ